MPRRHQTTRICWLGEIGWRGGEGTCDQTRNCASRANPNCSSSSTFSAPRTKTSAEKRSCAAHHPSNTSRPLPWGLSRAALRRCERSRGATITRSLAPTTAVEPCVALRSARRLFRRSFDLTLGVSPWRVVLARHTNFHLSRLLLRSPPRAALGRHNAGGGAPQSPSLRSKMVLPSFGAHYQDHSRKAKSATCELSAPQGSARRAAPRQHSFATRGPSRQDPPSDSY